MQRLGKADVAYRGAWPGIMICLFWLLVFCLPKNECWKKPFYQGVCCGLPLTASPPYPCFGAEQQEGGDKIEYRVWNPFRSKVAAAILGGVDNIHIKPGAKLLYLGGASGEYGHIGLPCSLNTTCCAPRMAHSSDAPSPCCTKGTTVSHCSDIVGPEGAVYAVEFSHRSGEMPPPHPILIFVLYRQRSKLRTKMNLHWFTKVPTTR